jgi:hypothetical protein
MYVSCEGLKPHLHKKLSHILTFICFFLHLYMMKRGGEKSQLFCLLNACNCFDSFYLIFIAYIKQLKFKPIILVKFTLVSNFSSMLCNIC